MNENGKEYGNPLQYSCWEKSHRQRSLEDYSLQGRKESDMTEHIFMNGSVIPLKFRVLRMSYPVYFRLQTALFYIYIYLFLAMLGLHCCVWAFSTCGEREATFQLQYAGFLLWQLLLLQSSIKDMQVSAVTAYGLRSCSSQVLEHRLNNCDTRAQLHHGTWDVLGSEIKPTSPALAGRFFTTEPPGKPGNILNWKQKQQNTKVKETDIIMESDLFFPITDRAHTQSWEVLSLTGPCRQGTLF